MSVRSWDIFDTLIGRRCGEATALFEFMGKRLEISDFVHKRKAAERVFQDKFIDYTLDDIYKQFDELYKTGRKWEFLADFEFQLEKDFVFGIQRNIVRLEKGDILVSDMYLTEHQIRELIEIAIPGFDFDNHPIYVSCYGKNKETIWPELKKKHEIIQHHGDNEWSDVRSPSKHGIRGTLMNTDYNPIEKNYRNFSQPLAAWVRSMRLEHFLPSAEQDNLHFLQAQFNLPLLWISAQFLEMFRDAGGVKKLLFMSRDGQMFQKVYNRMYSGRKTEYLYISRECLRGDSTDFFKYFNKKMSKTAMMVDLASSLGSLKVALPKLNVTLPKVYCTIHLKEPWKVDPIGVDLKFMTDNIMCPINNTHVEMLNYAKHWHVFDVKDGKALTDQKDEYNMDLVKQYHEFVYEQLPYMPEPADDVSLENLRKIGHVALHGIEVNKAFLRRTFPGHMEMEMKRKNTFKVLSDERKPRTNKKLDVVVVGSVWNLEWPDMKTWFMSLQKSRFKGNIHLLSYEMSSKHLNRARRAGCSASEHQLEFGHVVVDRFKHLSDYANSLHPDTWVIATDVTDIAFQFNPVEYLKTVPLNKSILVASEGIRFTGNQWVTQNLKNSFPEHWHGMRNQFLYNAGSFAAKAGILVELSMEVFEMSMTRPTAKNHDQAALNILLQSGKYNKHTEFTGANDGWAHAAASSIYAKPEDQAGYLEDMPVIDNGVLYVQNGAVLCCIFHHYDRNARMKSIVRTLYS